MILTNAQILTHVDARLKLTREMKRKLKPQIDNLITTLTNAINAHPELKVLRVILAGSWKKGTAIRPRGDRALDVDIVFFLDIDDAADIVHLHDTLLRFLLAAYPTKDPKDFQVGDKTLNLVFRGSGLMVDLVPVVPIDGLEQYVRQPSRTPAPSVFVTSVDRQLEFARVCKEANPCYTAVVRLAKAWRDEHELEVSSFSLELLCAHLDLTRGVETSIESSLIRFFETVARRTPPHVSFPDAIGAVPAASSPPMPHVSDPTYNPNNVLARVSAAEWEEVRGKAEAAWEALEWARSKTGKGETLALWRKVFGSNFDVESEAA